MQQDPAPDELHRELGADDHQLGDQDERNETEVIVADTGIHQALRQEGQDQLQQADRHHPQHQLDHLTAVRVEVTEKVADPPAAGPLLLAQRPEIRTRLQQQGRVGILAVHPGAEPAAGELLPAVGDPPRRGIGNVKVPLPDPVADHKMGLVPMQDARQRAMPLQLVERHPHPLRPEPDRLRRLTDPQHRHPLAGDKGPFPQVLDRVGPTIIAGNHPQTGRAAVHRVKLLVDGEWFTYHICYIYYYYLSLPKNRTGLLSSSNPRKRWAKGSFFNISYGSINMTHQPSSKVKNCLGNQRKSSSNKILPRTLPLPSFLSTKPMPSSSSFFPLNEKRILSGDSI